MMLTLSQARLVAPAFMSFAEDHFEKLQLTGAVRREIRHCRTIELLGVPRLDDLGALTLDSAELPAGVTPTGRTPKQRIFSVRPGDLAADTESEELLRDWADDTSYPALCTVVIRLVPMHSFGWLHIHTTGPTSYSRHVAVRLRQAGYVIHKGRITRDGELIHVPSERAVFDLLHSSPPTPNRRSLSDRVAGALGRAEDAGLDAHGFSVYPASRSNPMKSGVFSNCVYLASRWFSQWFQPLAAKLDALARVCSACARHTRDVRARAWRVRGGFASMRLGRVYINNGFSGLGPRRCLDARSASVYLGAQVPVVTGGFALDGGGEA